MKTLVDRRDFSFFFSLLPGRIEWRLYRWQKHANFSTAKNYFRNSVNSEM